MMIPKLLALVLLLSATLLAGRAHAALSVITTTSDLAAVTKAIGKDRVRVRPIVLPSQDPHFVDPRPSLALELSRADLLISIGADLESGWLPTLLIGSRNPRIQNGELGSLQCASLVELLDRPSGKIDRSMGDVHASGNPHFMLDPRTVERVAVGIGKRLAELDPPGRAHYLDATKQFVEELREARKGWEEALGAVRGREVVAFHRSLAYLANYAGLVVVEHIEPKPGVPPNPRHVAHVIATGQARQVKLLLQESYYPTSTSELVARKLNARLIRIAAAPNFAAGQSYVAFMTQIVQQIIGGK